MDDYTNELTVEMLQDGLYRKIAQTIGIDNFYKLACTVGGSTIYIPRAESLLRPVRDAHIKAEFTGFNHVALAEKYNVTERWVRQLCGTGFAEGQIGFFDETFEP